MKPHALASFLFVLFAPSIAAAGGFVDTCWMAEVWHNEAGGTECFILAYCAGIRYGDFFMNWMDLDNCFTNKDGTLLPLPK